MTHASVEAPVVLSHSHHVEHWSRGPSGDRQGLGPLSAPLLGFPQPPGPSQLEAAQRCSVSALGYQMSFSCDLWCSEGVDATSAFRPTEEGRIRTKTQSRGLVFLPEHQQAPYVILPSPDPHGKPVGRVPVPTALQVIKRRAPSFLPFTSKALRVTLHRAMDPGSPAHQAKESRMRRPLRTSSRG